MNLKLILAILVAISVTGLLSFVSTTQVSAQGQSTALERGYRTGYSDGYTAGFKDVSDKAARDYQSKEDYQRADRSFNDAWGPIEDYRDGYQQGFETGYNAGYERQQFNSTLPTGLRRRGAARQSVDVNVQTPANNTPTEPAENDNTQSTAVTTGSGSLAIPRNTILALELITPVSTDASQRGDRIQARVVEPQEYAGYIVDGHIAQVKRPGKVKGTAQLQLAF